MNGGRITRVSSTPIILFTKIMPLFRSYISSDLGKVQEFFGGMTAHTGVFPAHSAEKLLGRRPRRRRG